MLAPGFSAIEPWVDQGIVWRFLVAAPNSTQGTRFWQEVTAGHNSALDSYYQSISALLRKPLPLRAGTRNEVSPRPLTLDDEARAFWITFSNEIERRVGLGGDLHSISGFANKLPEHATRLAGILTIYEDANARQITKEAMQNGFALGTYYAQTTIRLHAAAHVNAELLEAEELLHWLHSRWCPSEGPIISVPELVQLGPNAIRDTRKARQLIAILEQHRHLRRLPARARVGADLSRLCGLPQIGRGMVEAQAEAGRAGGSRSGSADLAPVEGIRACRVRGADPRRRARQQPSLGGVDGLLTRRSLTAGRAARGRDPQGPQGSRGDDQPALKLSPG